MKQWKIIEEVMSGAQRVVASFADRTKAEQWWGEFMVPYAGRSLLVSPIGTVVFTASHRERP